MLAGDGIPDRHDIPISCYSGFAYSAAEEAIPAADYELLLRCCCRHIVVLHVIETSMPSLPCSLSMVVVPAVFRWFFGRDSETLVSLQSVVQLAQ